MATIGTLKRITARDLSEKLLTGRNAQGASLAIVDVRDDDHLGGHIRSSLHFPSKQMDSLMPTLCRKLKDTRTVVFHCMLSQERGPKAALRYLRERDSVLKALGEERLGEGTQEVYVLDRGFQGWQEEYGGDERLTESYEKSLWE